MNERHTPRAEGVNVCIHGHRLMRDDEIYSNADEFDRFRHQMLYHQIDVGEVDPTVGMRTIGVVFLALRHGVVPAQ